MTSNASPASDRKRPFWKEPMMWVVLGIPLASIVAGVGLVVVSVRSGSADAVMDKVDRVSQIQTTDLGPDEAAAARKLSAIVQIRADHVELVPVTAMCTPNCCSMPMCPMSSELSSRHRPRSCACASSLEEPSAASMAWEPRRSTPCPGRSTALPSG